MSCKDARAWKLCQALNAWLCVIGGARVREARLYKKTQPVHGARMSVAYVCLPCMERVFVVSGCMPEALL